MTKAVFDQISDGLKEALAVSRGLSSPFSLHDTRTLDVAAIRNKVSLSIEDFAIRFGFDPVHIREWEQGLAVPVGSNRAFLLLIQDDPNHVIRVLAQSENPPLDLGKLSGR